MRRDDLTMALMQGWARLDLAGRDKFFDEFLRAALRLDQRGLRAWLRRRLRTPPLGLPFDLATLELTAGDLALLDAQSKLP